MARTTNAVRARYEYDKRAMRYRDRRTGVWVKTASVKAATTRVINGVRKDMRALADDMAKGRIKLADWQRRMEQEIKSLHVSMAMAGAGGMGQMTQADYGRVGRRLRFEYERLARFAEQIKTGTTTLGAIRARVDMYITSGHTTHEDARRAQAIEEGYTHERNVLGNTDHHCTDGERPGCTEMTKMGVVPLGTLTPPGRRQCISRCDCSIRYSRITR